VMYGGLLPSRTFVYLGKCLEDLLQGGSLNDIIKYQILNKVAWILWTLHDHYITYFGCCGQ
jgi:hypothetical protein